MSKLEIWLTLLGVVAAIFVAVAITYVGLKQVEATVRGQPTCFPPYFLMGRMERAYAPTVPRQGYDDGLRPHGPVTGPNTGCSWEVDTFYE